MAYFKKRRKPGPSKNEEKVMRGREAAADERARGTLARRFPGVQKVVVRVDFLTQQGQPFDNKILDFSANDPCEFVVECPGRCGRGAFDLAPIVETAVGAGGRAESMFVCEEAVYAPGTERCGLQLKCAVEAQAAKAA